MLKNSAFILFTFLLIACENESTQQEKIAVSKMMSEIAKNEEQPMADNSRNALDWQGTYKGTLPCADCEGIEVSIEIDGDHQVNVEQVYTGRSTKRFTQKGKFEWNKEGSKITCFLPDSKDSMKFLVGENQLIQLDKEGNQISGVLANYYVLKKENMPQEQLFPITETLWLMQTLKNEKISETAQNGKPFSLQLHAANNRFNAFAGCNNIFGVYEIKENNTIDFGDALSTMMACLNMEFEKEFTQLLPQITSYQLKGNQLLLFVKNKEVASFVAEVKK